MNIMNYIGKGRENAVTRAQLVAQLHLPDRKVRNMIEEARRRGEIIINRQDGAGYYTSEALPDLQRQYNANQNRAMSILVQQKYLRRKIKELEEAQNEEKHDT